MNNVCITGRIVRKPELRYLPHNGTALTNFTVAIDKMLSKEKKQEMESKGQTTADFIPITVWGKTAESCVKYLDKGVLVGIQGRIQTNNYTTDKGEKRTSFDVVANNVEFMEWLED